MRACCTDKPRKRLSEMKNSCRNMPKCLACLQRMLIYGFQDMEWNIEDIPYYFQIFLWKFICCPTSSTAAWC